MSKRILVASRLTPAPPDRGDRIRGFEMLQALSQVGQVHLAVMTDQPPSTRIVDLIHGAGVSEIRHIPVRRYEHWCGTLGAAIMGRPWSTARLPRVARELSSWAVDWDMVVAFQLRAAYYVSQIHAPMRVLELTDSLSLYRASLPVARHPLRWLSLAGVAREERKWVHQFDVTVVCAAADASAVRSIVRDADVRIIENGTEPRRIPTDETQRDALLFVGNMRYPPNWDGVMWFLHRVWPTIAKIYDNLEFRVVGDGAPRRLWPRGPRVKWMGYAADLGAEYERAIALVNPVFYGSGTRRKILNAWAAGLPVVSTTGGAAGLEYQKGQHLLIADSETEFYDAIAALMARPELRKRLGTAACHWAVERYSSERLWSRALEDIEATLGQPSIHP